MAATGLDLGFDPYAGRLSRRSRRLWATGAAVALALLAGAGVGYTDGWWSTSLQARAVMVGSDSDLGLFKTTVAISSSGPGMQRIVAVGRSGAGLRLESVQGLPVDLAPGGLAEITLVYRLEDCSAREAGRWPLPVTVERPWGTSRVDADLELSTPWSDAGSGEGGAPVQWQAAALDALCDR
jgi:hypothetical protein